MTTLYPMCLFPTPLLCVLLNIHRFEILNASLALDNCILIQKIHINTNSSELDFAVVELNANIQFTLGVTRAVFRYEPPTVTTDGTFCSITYNKRTPSFKIYDIYVGLDVLSITEYVKYFIAKVKTNRKTTFCPFDNGLPLICNSHVVGLMSEINGDYCERVSVYDCMKKCRSVSRDQIVELRYTNLGHSEVSMLLDELKLDWWEGIKSADD